MKIRDILAAAGIILLLSLAGGCAEMLACKTVIAYRADGSWEYQSCKNQENLKAELGLSDQGKLNKLNVQTTALTPEAAIAGALQVQTELLRQLLPILQKGAMGGT